MNPTIDPGDASLFAGWLKAMGLQPNRVMSPQVNWCFEVAYPIGSEHRLNIINPKERSQSVVIVSAAHVSPEHLAAFEGLDQDAKNEFLWELRTTANQDFTEYTFHGSDHPLACPNGFEISSTRFPDGLSLDSFNRSVSSVFKTFVAVLSCVQRHLNDGPGGGGGSGYFAFKRIATQ